MDNKKIIILTCLNIVFVIISGIAISFAFMGKAAVENRANVTGNVMNVTGAYNVSFSPSASASLNVTLEDLKAGEASNDYSSYVENNIVQYIKISSDNTKAPEGIRCNYDIYYTPTTIYDASTGAKEVGLIELALVGSSSTSKSFGPISLSGIKTKTKIYSTSIASGTGGEEITENWNISMRYYNLLVDQVSALGQNPKGKVTLELGECNLNN